MTYMLDTNICIYAIKNKPEQVLERLEANLSKGLCISAITLAELEHGVEKEFTPGQERGGAAAIPIYTGCAAF